MARSSRSISIALLVALAMCASWAVFAAQAPAKDSLAPKGAGDRWLPCERWVMYHWNPIDMPAFYERTGIRQTELFDWLQDDDHHDLAGIIKSKGLDPKETVRATLAIRSKASARTRRALTERAYRLLTQGHLAQHEFFHWFHNPAVRQNAREIFGMNSWDYMRARRLGFSPADIGRLKRGYTRAETGARIVKVLARYEWRGERGRATTREQAEHYIARITKLVDVWLDQRYHKKRPKGGLPPATRGSSGNASRMCRELLGRDQVGDGFDKSNAASAAGHHSLLCPLAEATRRELEAEGQR